MRSSACTRRAVAELDPGQVLGRDARAARRARCRSLPRCHVSIARPPLGASAPSTTASAVSSVVDVDVVGHELVDDLRVVCGAASAHSSPKRSVIRRSSHGVPAMLPTLMWWAGSAAAASNSSARSRRRDAALVGRVEEPVASGTRAREVEPVVVEDVRASRRACGTRARARGRRARARCRGSRRARPAAQRSREVEQAPLAAEVHLDRAGRGPVEPIRSSSRSVMRRSLLTGGVTSSGRRRRSG